MKEVTIDNVRERIARIEECASRMPGGLRLSMNTEFELACLRALLGMMQSVQVLPSGWRMVPTEPQAAPEKYNIGEATMLHIFTATGMTDVSDMQAVFDQVEKALVKLERKPKVIEPDGWRGMMTRLANGLELMTSLASERAISVDTCVCLEWVRDARAMLNQAQAAATDNTAQQFEALATSAHPEIIGYEHRLICGELRRVPKFAGQDIEATSKAPDALEARRRRNRESNRRARALETPEHANQRRQRNRERMRAARSGKP